MTFLEFIILTLLSFGITNILVNGSIFKPIRDWVGSKADNWFTQKIFQLISCMMCMGFWVGAFCGIFLGPFPWWNIVFNGALMSGTTWIIHCILQYLGSGYDPAKTISIQLETPIVIKGEGDDN
jgi:hypothetical protein